VPAVEVRVGPRFFDTMGISFVSGETFTGDFQSFSGLILSESLAVRLFGTENPVGRSIFVGAASNIPSEEPSPLGPILGVVQNVRHNNVREESPLTVYWPGIIAESRFAARTESEAANLLPGLRRVVEDFDPDFRISRVRTLQDAREAAIAPARFVADLAGLFGLASLALASIGTFGVFSYSVTRRQREIGIRMALGAQPGSVIRMFMRETLWVVGLGVALELVASFARLVTSILFGVYPMDPVSVVAAVLILIAVSTSASYLPARRASHFDPSVALRQQE